MAFWDIFNKKSNNNGGTSGTGDGSCRLQRETIRLLPDANPEQQVRAACLAGIMSQVAWCDLDIRAEEVENMKAALKKWTDLEEQEVTAVVSLALDNVQELAGLENYKYTEVLSTTMEHGQRFGLLKALFALAAADGSVAEKEAEEIRLICKGLLLEHKHFISAKATVLEHLAALN